MRDLKRWRFVSLLLAFGGGAGIALLLHLFDISSKNTNLLRDDSAPRLNERQLQRGLAKQSQPTTASEAMFRGAACDVSARCGLAMACLSGNCRPCTQDNECADGEGCVRASCVLRANIGCRTSGDCSERDECLLSGLTSDPRNNAGLAAACRPTSGQAGEAEPTELTVGVPAPAAVVDIQRLSQLAREQRRRDGGQP